MISNSICLEHELIGACYSTVIVARFWVNTHLPEKERERSKVGGFYVIVVDAVLEFNRLFFISYMQSGRCATVSNKTRLTQSSCIGYRPWEGSQGYVAHIKCSRDESSLMIIKINIINSKGDDKTINLITQFGLKEISLPPDYWMYTLSISML